MASVRRPGSIDASFDDTNQRTPPSKTEPGNNEKPWSEMASNQGFYGWAIQASIL